MLPATRKARAGLVLVSLLALQALAPAAGRSVSDRKLQEDGPNRKMLIYGGAANTFAAEVSPRFQRYPWFASIRGPDLQQACGASVINYGASRTAPGKLSGRILLTAAHCFKDGVLSSLSPDFTNPLVNKILNPEIYINPHWNDVAGGVGNSTNIFAGQIPFGGPYATVHRTTYGTWVHPAYEMDVVGGNRAPKENDIALILLDAQVGPPGGNTIKNGPMPWIAIPPAGATHSYRPPNNFGQPGETLRLVGLGMTSKSPAVNTDRLRSVDLRLNTLGESITHAGVVPNAARWGANSRISAGSVTPNAGNGTRRAPGTTSSACPGDSGGALFRFNQGAQAGWAGDGPVIGTVSYQDSQAGPQCGDSPVVFTDVANQIAWIRQTIATMEAQFKLYQIDMNFKCLDKSFAGPAFPDYQGTLDFGTTRQVSRLLSTVLQKTKTGNSPFAVDYYSWKYDATKGTSRLRYQWTTKKAKMEVFNFFPTGVYSANPPLTANSGPLSLVRMPNNGFLSFLTKTKPTYFRNFADQVENILLEGIDETDNTVECAMKDVQITFFNTAGAATVLETSNVFSVPSS